MNFKKRVNGSWVDTPNYIHKTDTDTFTTFPAVLYPTGTTATVGLKGNTVQSGTPTPQSPVMPQGTGERTGNLYPLDESKLHVGRIENDGTIDYEVGTLTVGINSVTYEANATWRGFYTDFIQVNENEKLKISPNDSAAIAWSCNCYDENDNFLGKAPAQSAAFIRTFTLLTGTKKVRISVTSSDTTYTILRPMLNTGSTPLPYEPYGYKIPISSNSTTTPVYLGEVQTTRKIKKYEFTGQETGWNYSTNGGRTRAYIALSDSLGASLCICSHYDYVSSTIFYPDIDKFTLDSSGSLLIGLDSTIYADVNAFKTYLAQQYAAGTPVCVWYVLAESTTGIVNEPLRKIGNYADTVSGITIPTISGADSFDVLTTLKPSEVDLTYTGWHDASAKEWDGSQWD